MPHSIWDAHVDVNLKRLDDIDRQVLRALIAHSVEEMRKRSPRD